MSLALLFLALLPPRIDPPAPFPRVIADAPAIATIAPGIESGEYDLITNAGPIVVRVVAIAPHHPDIRLSSVLAGDTLTGSGETVSSMAHRTDAVAGINADYFDIGNTNAPTNIVVHDGSLVRTPRKRFSLVALDDGSVQIVENTFLGQVQVADRTVALDAVNEFPPPNRGIAIITPAFGPVPPLEDLTLISLAPSGGTPPFTQYTVSGVADNTSRQEPGYYLAIGVDAYAKTGVPNDGDRIDVSGDLSPLPLSAINAAVGGGPLLLDAGAPVEDPDGPTGPEFEKRIPSSGAALNADGTLLLLEVDGRQPFESVGLTRPEFAALMRAFGARRGMAFDGGGSSTIVERERGSSTATIANSPSDGIERPVADGFFAYSSDPIGAPSQIDAQPTVLRALVGAHESVRIFALDDADHVVAPGASIAVTVDPARLGEFHDGVFAALAPGTGSLEARSGALLAHIPIEVTVDPSRLAIAPQRPNVARNGTLTLHARAFDAAGYPIALPDELPWRATGARIDDSGTLSAGTDNALVSLLIGDHLANSTVTVGSHDSELAIPESAHFMTAPRGGEGGISRQADCTGCVSLRYQLGPQERAAYAILGVQLPEDSIAISFELLDDGGGAKVRLALRNAIDEEVLLSASALDHPGWRRVTVDLPQALAQPARLTGIYVIGARVSDTAAGTIEIKGLTVSVAGPK